MYYASIGILAFIIHVIINYDVLIKTSASESVPARRSYRNFLFSVLLYYFMDVFWEVLDYFELTELVFFETEVYYTVMAFCVFFWTQYVIDYLNKKNWFANALKYTGWAFLILQILILILNLFIPIAFWFDAEGEYHTEAARTLNMLFQFIMFLATTIYMGFATIKTEGRAKHRHRAFEMFGITMTVFIILHTAYPMLPYYAIGFLIGTCIIHTFVLEDEKMDRQEELERRLQIEQIQEAEISSARQMAFKDPLTGVKSKAAYQEDALGIDNRKEKGLLDNFGVIVFDVNDLKKTNDTKGHDAGDKIIQAASKIICQTFKHSPVYRIGGDEFAAFLMGEDYKNRVSLITSFNQQIEKNKEKGQVVVSCGLADLNEEKSENYAGLFAIADNRMYQRKKQLKGLL